MTNKHTDALEEFDRFCRFIDGMHMSGTFVENDFMSKPIQKLIRAALSPVDAESLKKDEADAGPSITDLARVRGWNDCLDELVKRGVLR
ncbi:hypothetical protein UFOVP353_41 [uncultured Caudovirales phage]|uniref:Uncharacterized protein n=1 Tax=uncultured Caudovirales phage TaxID=2100421 RepID=A0A6J5M0Z6_9CAUD|nr:hypothetical protein UFOVP353_41 [uncultured Caudovirales phage]